MTGLIERAPTRQVAPEEFVSDFRDGHRQAPREQIVAISADSLDTAQIERMRIPPLRRPRDDHRRRRQAAALPSAALHPLRRTMRRSRRRTLPASIIVVRHPLHD
jgi:hypothetical protein